MISTLLMFLYQLRGMSDSQRLAVESAKAQYRPLSDSERIPESVFARARMWTAAEWTETHPHIAA